MIAVPPELGGGIEMISYPRYVPFTGARAFDESSDIHKLDCRGRDFFRTRNLDDFFKARIWNRYNADIRIDRAKWIIFCRRFMRACDRIEKRRLPNIRQSYNSST